MTNRSTSALANLIVDADTRGLSGDVAARAKQHLLDGIVSMISGATLPAGRLGIAYAGSRGGPGESSVMGGSRTNPELAAFANALSAHADETDDVNNAARIHPGATIVPAALAMAEAYERNGSELLTAVSLGYDFACAVNLGAWTTFHSMQQSPRTSHGLGQTFGAMAAAAYLARLTPVQTRHALSYAAQQVAGVASFYRDPDHIEKAFVTAGMEAHAGVRAVELVAMGFTGVDDVFDGTPGVLDAFGHEGSAQKIIEDLESTRHVTTTDIKKYPVGGPIQAPLEAILGLISAHALTASQVKSIEARVPTQGAYIVDNRSMPDINLQYILSVALLDGRITFASSHDYQRLKSHSVSNLMRKIRVIGDAAFDVAAGRESLSDRQTWRGEVVVQTTDGRVLAHRVMEPKGVSTNPLTWSEVTDKASMMLEGVLPEAVTAQLVDWVHAVDKCSNTRDIRQFYPAQVLA